MPLKKSVRKYFVFSKKERNVALFLCLLIGTVLFIPEIDRFWFNPPDPIFDKSQYITLINTDNTAVDSAVRWQGQKSGYGQRNYHSDSREFFQSNNKYAMDNTLMQLHYFNPDTVTNEQWIQMGVPTFVASRICRYIEKGGSFNSGKSLLEIYGFDTLDYERIAPWILKDSSENIFESKQEINIRTDTVIEINSATTLGFVMLGFSVSDAEQIIRFRESAGGFNSVEQLYGIHGLDQKTLLAVLPYIICDESAILIININTATVEQLAKHAYISEDLARAIILYRDSTGRFTSLKELMKVKGMYPTLFDKLKPYLSL